MVIFVVIGDIFPNSLNKWWWSRQITSSHKYLTLFPGHPCTPLPGKFGIRSIRQKGEKLQYANRKTWNFGWCWKTPFIFYPPLISYEGKSLIHNYTHSGARHHLILFLKQKKQNQKRNVPYINTFWNKGSPREPKETKVNIIRHKLF